MSTNASFNGSSLQTFDGNHGILLQQIHHAGKSAKQAQNYALSHANRNVIPFVEYPSKPITLIGEIIGTTISDADTQIDLFNSLISPTNAPLCFDYAGGSLNRLYYATAGVPDVSRPDGLAWAEFNVTFIAQSFGRDITTTSLLNQSGRTAASYSDSITLAGNAPFQLPIITITFSAVSDTTGLETVSVGNGATGQQLNITRIWAATDVLTIDCTFADNTPVKVNGIPVNFTGAFPAFFTGAGTLTYHDTFSTRTFAETAVYYKNYL